MNNIKKIIPELLEKIKERNYEKIVNYLEHFENELCFVLNSPNSVMIELVSNKLISENMKESLIQLLIKRNIFRDSSNYEGKCCLHVCFENNYLSLIKYFKHQKNFTDNYGKVPEAYFMVEKNGKIELEKKNILDDKDYKIKINESFLDKMDNLDVVIPHIDMFYDIDYCNVENSVIDIYSSFKNIKSNKLNVSFVQNHSLGPSLYKNTGKSKWDTIHENYWNELLENTLKEDLRIDEIKNLYPIDKEDFINSLRTSILLGFSAESYKDVNNFTNIKDIDILECIRKVDSIITHPKAVNPRFNIINFEKKYFIKGHNYMEIYPLHEAYRSLTYDVFITKVNYYDFKNWFVLRLFRRYNKNPSRIIDHFSKVCCKDKSSPYDMNIMKDTSNLNWKELFWFLVSLPDYGKSVNEVLEAKGGNGEVKKYSGLFFTSPNSPHLNGNRYKETLINDFLKSKGNNKYLRIRFGMEIVILFKYLEENSFNKSISGSALLKKYSSINNLKSLSSFKEDHSRNVIQYDISERRKTSSFLNMNELLILPEEKMTFLDDLTRKVFCENENIEGENNEDKKIYNFISNGRFCNRKTNSIGKMDFVNLIIRKLNMLYMASPVNIDEIPDPEKKELENFTFDIVKQYLKNVVLNAESIHKLFSDFRKEKLSTDELFYNFKKKVSLENRLYQSISKISNLNIDPYVKFYIILGLFLISDIWDKSIGQFHNCEDEFINNVLSSLYERIDSKLENSSKLDINTNIKVGIYSQLKDNILGIQQFKNILFTYVDKKYEWVYILINNIDTIASELLKIFQNPKLFYYSGITSLLTIMYNILIKSDENIFKFTPLDLVKKAESQGFHFMSLVPIFVNIIFFPNIVIEILTSDSNLLHIINSYLKWNISKQDLVQLKSVSKELRYVFYDTFDVYYVNTSHLNIVLYCILGSIRVLINELSSPASSPNVEEDKTNNTLKNYYSQLAHYEAQLHSYEFMLMFNDKDNDVDLFLNHMSSVNMDKTHLYSVLMKVYGVHPKRQNIMKEVLRHHMEKMTTLDNIIMEQNFYGVFLAECLDLFYISDIFPSFFEKNNYEITKVSNEFGQIHTDFDFKMNYVVLNENSIKEYKNLQSSCNFLKNIRELSFDKEEKIKNTGMSSTGKYICALSSNKKFFMSHDYGNTFDEFEFVMMGENDKTSLDNYILNQIEISSCGSEISFYLKKTNNDNLTEVTRWVSQDYTLNFTKENIDIELTMLRSSSKIQKQFFRMFRDFFTDHSVISRIKQYSDQITSKIEDFSTLNHRSFHEHGQVFHKLFSEDHFKNMKWLIYFLMGNSKDTTTTNSVYFFEKYMNYIIYENKKNTPINYYLFDSVLENQFNRFLGNSLLIYEYESKNHKIKKNHFTTVEVITYTSLFTKNQSSTNNIEVQINKIHEKIKSLEKIFNFYFPEITKKIDSLNLKLLSERHIITYHEEEKHIDSIPKKSSVLIDDETTPLETIIQNFNVLNINNDDKYIIESDISNLKKYLEEIIDFTITYKILNIEIINLIKTNYQTNIKKIIKKSITINTETFQYQTMNHYHILKLKNEINALIEKEDIFSNPYQPNSFSTYKKGFISQIHNVSIFIQYLYSYLNDLNEFDNNSSLLQYKNISTKLQEMKRSYIGIFNYFMSNESDTNMIIKSVVDNIKLENNVVLVNVKVNKGKEQINRNIYYVSKFSDKKKVGTIRNISLSLNGKDILVSTNEILAFSTDYGESWDLSYLKYHTNSEILYSNLNSNKNNIYVIIKSEQCVYYLKRFNIVKSNEEKSDFWVLTNDKLNNQSIDDQVFYNDEENKNVYESEYLNVHPLLETRLLMGDSHCIQGNIYENRVLLCSYNGTNTILNLITNHLNFYNDTILYKNQESLLILKEDPDISSTICGSRIDSVVSCSSSAFNRYIKQAKSLISNYYTMLRSNFPKQNTHFVFLYSIFIEEITTILKRVETLKSVMISESSVYEKGVENVYEEIKSNATYLLNESYPNFIEAFNKKYKSIVSVFMNNRTQELYFKTLIKEISKRLNMDLGLVNLYHFLTDSNTRDYYITRHLIKTRYITYTFHSFKSMSEKYPSVDVINFNELYKSYYKEKSVYECLDFIKDKDKIKHYNSVYHYVSKYIEYANDVKIYNSFINSNKYILLSRDQIKNEKPLKPLQEFFIKSHKEGVYEEDIVFKINSDFFKETTKWDFEEEMEFYDNYVLLKMLNSFSKTPSEKIMNIIINNFNHVLFLKLCEKNKNSLNTKFLRLRINEKIMYISEFIEKVVMDKEKKASIDMKIFYSDLYLFYDTHISKVKDNYTYFDNLFIEKRVSQFKWKILDHFSMIQKDKDLLFSYILFAYNLTEKDLEGVEFNDYISTKLGDNYRPIIKYLYDIRSVVSNFCRVQVILNRLNLMIYSLE